MYSSAQARPPRHHARSQLSQIDTHHHAVSQLDMPLKLSPRESDEKSDEKSSADLRIENLTLRHTNEQLEKRLAQWQARWDKLKASALEKKSSKTTSPSSSSSSSPPSLSSSSSIGSSSMSPPKNFVVDPSSALSSPALGTQTPSGQLSPRVK